MNKSKKQLAEQLYKNKLREIEKMMKKKDITYLEELDIIGRRLFRTKFRGVYPSDKIPPLNNLTPYAILNLDKSGEPGSHWVAIARSKHQDASYFYDSFGRRNTKLMPNLRISGNGRIKDTELDKEQKIRETNCGQRCLAFLAIFNEYGEDVAKLI
jgi:hypothetical protein